jgi:ATP phosphoribosyltransferase regulatory subunit
VLHTRPRGLHATREQIQVGAELYGHAGLEADVEVQQLMLDAMRLAGFDKVRLDLCHAGVLAALFAREPAAAAMGETLYEALAGKDVARLDELTQGLDAPIRDALRLLPSLYGDASVLELARQRLPQWPDIAQALDDLTFLAAQVEGAEVTIDLADLRGYAYHSGVMFSAYVDGVSNAVARGGRYDHVGQAYGRARAATGFSLDLRELARILPAQARSSAILAPWRHDDALRASVAALRDAGEIVIQALPGHDHDLDEFACDRVLIERDGAWVVEVRRP